MQWPCGWLGGAASVSPKLSFCWAGLDFVRRRQGSCGCAMWSKFRCSVCGWERARPEGHAVKVTKTGKGRLVPVPSHVASIVRGMAEGKGPDDLLVTTDRGGSLHANRFRASSGRDEYSDGRRLYDLRHTAVCLWLSSGVPVSTAKEWAGHADISTTNVYVTFLGTDADRLDVARLERPGVGADPLSCEGSELDSE